MSSAPGDAPSPLPEVLVIGRSGVDLYPLQVGVGLEDVQTFGKFLGGSAANVAVAAARLGRRTALVTGVGDDPFGRYVRRALRELGVDDRHVVVDAGHLTPVTFCEVFPPDDFPLHFYRRPTAPDLQVGPGHLDLAAVAGADLLWLTATGLSQEPSRSAHRAALAARAGRRHTVLDLDHRADFWPDAATARREVAEVLGSPDRLVTVAVGNREECAVAVGQADPDAAADALLDVGVELAVVKMGPRGVMGATRTQRVVVPPVRVDVVNGLGAGDSFGGSLVHGLLAGWPLGDVLTRAAAAGALVASRLECSSAMPTAAEIEVLVASSAVAPPPAPAPAPAPAPVHQHAGRTR